MKKHNGNQGPLRSFVDDVCIGEPVVLREEKKKSHHYWNKRSVKIYESDHRIHVNIYITGGTSNPLLAGAKNVQSLDPDDK